MLILTSKFIEVNAQKFIIAFAGLVSNKELMEDLMNDEHYIFRIYSDAIECGYPEDKPVIVS